MPKHASENVFLEELSLWLPCLTFQALVMGHYVCNKYEIAFPSAF